MDVNTYLSLLHSLIKSGYLIHKSSVRACSNKGIHKAKDIMKKRVKTQILLGKFKLPKKDAFLILEGTALEFHLMHSIIIGEDAILYSCKHISTQETLIGTKQTLQRIHKEIDKDSIKKLKGQEFHQEPFMLAHKRSPKLSSLIAFTLKDKNINLNRIHKVPGNKLELFTPTLKNSHHKLASVIGLPLLRPLIKNNFIEETTTHIFDEKYLIQCVEHVSSYTTKQLSLFSKKHKERLFLDLREELILELPEKYLKEKLTMIQKSNITLEKLQYIINGGIRIRIATSHATSFPLLLFKSFDDQGFLPIKNAKEFLDLTGIHPSLDPKKLASLHLQNLEGVKSRYIDMYLINEVIKVFENFSNTQIIQFSNKLELCCYLLLIDKKKTFIHSNPISRNQRIQLHRLINSILTNLINLGIKQAQVSPEKDPHRILATYFAAKKSLLDRFTNSFQSIPNKMNYCKKIIRELEQVKLIMKHFSMTHESFREAVCYMRLILEYLKDTLQEDLKDEISLSQSYFKTITESNNKQHNPKLLSTLNALAKAASLSRTVPVKVILKNKKLIDIIPIRIRVLQSTPTPKEYFHVNHIYLKNTMRYLRKELIPLLQKNQEIQPKIFTIGKQTIPFRKEFIKKIIRYPPYSFLFENEHILILFSKQEAFHHQDLQSELYNFHS